MKKTSMRKDRLCVLSGGVGGAKLALGLSKVLCAEDFLIIANTGDDFRHFGLQISPDIDTIIYTLAGLVDSDRGWGLKNETWNFLESMKYLGAEGWFNLGDKDLATHFERTRRIDEGESLSDITRTISMLFEVDNLIVPMTDSPVQTIVDTQDGPLPFQHYFVRDRSSPIVTGFRFEGIEMAKPSPGILEFLKGNRSSVLIAPSNPFVSIDPILKVPGLRKLLKSVPSNRVAVSPIVNGSAIKGPAAKMMTELGIPSTSVGVANYYKEFVDGFVIDETDTGHVQEIEDLGLSVLVTKTIMNTLEDKTILAQECLDFIDSLSGK